MKRPQFIHPRAGDTWGCFCLLAVVDIAAVRSHIHGLCGRVSFTSGVTPRREAAGSGGDGASEVWEVAGLWSPAAAGSHLPPAGGGGTPILPRLTALVLSLDPSPPTGWLWWASPQ